MSGVIPLVRDLTDELNRIQAKSELDRASADVELAAWARRWGPSAVSPELRRADERDFEDLSAELDAAEARIEELGVEVSQKDDKIDELEDKILELEEQLADAQKAE